MPNDQHIQGITERIPLSLPVEVISRKDEIPIPWVRDIVDNSDKEKGIEALAMQFYRSVASFPPFVIMKLIPFVRVELGEQRRLQGVMSHHSKESYTANDEQPHSAQPHSAKDNQADPFPFSITAGVEKGAKNR